MKTTLIALIALMAVAATAGTNCMTRTEIYASLQTKALARVHSSICDEDANAALIWASTVTQLQAAELAEIMLVAKRTVVPNPELTFPALKQLGLFWLGQELREEGATGGNIMNLIEAFTSSGVSAQVIQATVQSATEGFVQASQAKAQYQAKARAMAAAMETKYEKTRKRGYGPLILGGADKAAVRAMIEEGNKAGHHVPYELRELED